MKPSISWGTHIWRHIILARPVCSHRTYGCVDVSTVEERGELVYHKQSAGLGLFGRLGVHPSPEQDVCPRSSLPSQLRPGPLRHPSSFCTARTQAACHANFAIPAKRLRSSKAAELESLKTWPGGARRRGRDRDGPRGRGGGVEISATEILPGNRVESSRSGVTLFWTHVDLSP